MQVRKMSNQKTINSVIHFEGIGLHTGVNSKIELVPAPANTGIVFIRKDLDSAMIKADLYSVANPLKFPRRTSVGANGVYVYTIEHLMASLHILGVDNLQVNVWGEEIPGLDGSAKQFVEKIKEVGLVEQEAPVNYLVVKEPLWVEEGSCSIVVLPYHTFRISYALRFDNPIIGSSFIDLQFDAGQLHDNFYEARTFCLEEEVKPLIDSGLGKGSNYDNTLVVSKKEVIKNKLRFPDEFVKHKILDLIGDLYLLGPIKGYVIAVKSGHNLNAKLLDKLRRYKEKISPAGIAAGGLSVVNGQELNVEEVMKILPHRYPFLLVDRIKYLDKGKKAIGIKNVSVNEAFFQGHFPGRPVMPGVLIIEAMAQVGGVLMLACEEHRGKLAFFMAVNNAKFRKTVLPGDQLIIEVTAGKIRSKTGSVNAKAFVDGKLATEAELMFAIVDA